ncbi:MAG: ornithine carbamoyltransferase [Candidatus Nanopelagicales bacterium]
MLQGRDFLKESDFSKAEFEYLISLAADLKSAKKSDNESRSLAGKNIALIFEKTSTRTRAALEVAAFDQGAHVTYFDPISSQIGHKESIADTARVLASMFDAISYRGFDQKIVETLAQYSSVPVINALTDQWHPTQMLADFLTMRESCQKDFSEISFAYLGDARNNMGNSLLVTAALLGASVNIVAPIGLQPNSEIQELAKSLAKTSNSRINITDQVLDGVKGVDFIHTDVWVSMGEAKSAWKQRIDLLTPYRVDSKVLAAAENPDVKFMHCLPAFHNDQTLLGKDIAEEFGLIGLEVTEEVFESKASIVFDQAENRMHTIKAVLVSLLT